MKEKDRRFQVTDALLLCGVLLPFVVGMLIKIFLIPPSEGVEIAGAKVFFTIPLPLGGLPISESQVNSWLVVIAVTFLCLYLTHGIRSGVATKRQHLAELAVEKTESLVRTNMGEYFAGFAPFIAAIMVLSAFSSLVTLCGLYPPTSDMNVVGGWALLVFILITYYKMKCGPVHYLKSFTEPVAFLTPINIVSEIATPVSMAFRHFGNVLSGSVISILVATTLQGISAAVLGWLPGVLSAFPLFQLGIPAVLSIYFDLFSGCLQAFIFAMLTMLYVAGAFPAEDYFRRKERKRKEQLQNNNA